MTTRRAPTRSTNQYCVTCKAITTFLSVMGSSFRCEHFYHALERVKEHAQTRRRVTPDMRDYLAELEIASEFVQTEEAQEQRHTAHETFRESGLDAWIYIITGDTLPKEYKK